MSLTRTVLASDGATHIRVSESAKKEINSRARKRRVAVWVIIDELLEATATNEDNE